MFDPESYMGVSVGHAAHKFVVVLKYGVAAAHELVGLLTVVVVPTACVVVPAARVVVPTACVAVPAGCVVVPAVRVVVTGFASHFFDVGFAYGAEVDGHVATHAFVAES